MKIIICKDCMTVGQAKSANGSFIYELGVWIAFIAISAMTGLIFLIVIPLIYTLYRFMSSSKKTCKSCSGQTIIDIYSPAGKKLLKESKQSIEDIEKEFNKSFFDIV